MSHSAKMTYACPQCGHSSVYENPLGTVSCSRCGWEPRRQTEDLAAMRRREPTIADLHRRAMDAGELDIAAGLANYDQGEYATSSLLDHWTEAGADERQIAWLAREIAALRA